MVHNYIKIGQLINVPSFVILKYLDKNTNCRIKQVLSESEFSMATIYNTIRVLEIEGYVEKTRNDLNENCILITMKGKSIYNLMQEIVKYTL